MKIGAYRLLTTITIALTLSGCVTPSQQYSNSPQAACNRLGLYSGEQYNECLINMGTIDRAAEQQQRISNCQNAKNAAGGGGFGAGFVNAMNVNQACN